MTTNTLLDIILAGFAISLPLGVVKHLIREKYAQQVLMRNERDKARTIKSNATTLKLTRLMLVTSPLTLILIPYGLHQYARVDLLRSITLTVLTLVTVGLEYLFQNWLHFFFTIG